MIRLSCLVNKDKQRRLKALAEIGNARKTSELIWKIEVPSNVVGIDETIRWIMNTERKLQNAHIPYYKEKY